MLVINRPSLFYEYIKLLCEIGKLFFGAWLFSYRINNRYVVLLLDYFYEGLLISKQFCVNFLRYLLVSVLSQSDITKED